MLPTTPRAHAQLSRLSDKARLAKQAAVAALVGEVEDLPPPAASKKEELRGECWKLRGLDHLQGRCDVIGSCD
jgi:hypothetical protein